MPEKIKKGYPKQAKKAHGLTIAQGKNPAQVSTALENLGYRHFRVILIY
jgi:hypothetical protein